MIDIYIGFWLFFALYNIFSPFVYIVLFLSFWTHTHTHTHLLFFGLGGRRINSCFFWRPLGLRRIGLCLKDMVQSHIPTKPRMWHTWATSKDFDSAQHLISITFNKTMVIILVCTHACYLGFENGYIYGLLMQTIIGHPVEWEHFGWGTSLHS